MCWGGNEREDEERGLSFRMHVSYLAGKAVRLAFMPCSAAFEQRESPRSVLKKKIKIK